MSRQIIDLSTQGEIQADSNKAYASLGYNAKLGLEFCHGFNLDLQLQALARAGLGANVGDYVKAAIDIEAGAQAGLQAAVQLSPDATKDIGLIAVVRAYIQAYIRARLSLGLTLDVMMANVQRQANELEFEIFKAFVEQIEVGIGVEANAQVGFTAIAQALCQGRLIEKDGEKAGFDIAFSAEAAFLKGAGHEVFTKLRFDDLPSFYKTANALLFEHVKQKAIANNPNEERVITLAIDICKFATDIAIVSASKNFTVKKNTSAVSFVSTLKHQFMADAVESIKQSLTDIHPDIEQFLHQIPLSDTDDLQNEDIKKAKTLLTQLKAAFETAETADDLPSILRLLENLSAILVTLSFPKIDKTIELLTTVFCLSYIFSDEGDKANFNPLPNLIADDYFRVCNTRKTQFDDNKDAYLYLEKGSYVQWMLDNTGKLGWFFKAILNITHQAGHSLTAILTLLFEQPDKTDQNTINQIGFDILGVLFTDYVIDAIDKQVRPYLLQTDTGEDYYDIVFKNTLSGLPNAILPALKLLLSDNDYIDSETGKVLTAEEKAERIERFVHLYLIGILAKNVNFATQTLLKYSTQSIETNLNGLVQNLNSPSFDYMAYQLFDALEHRVNAILPIPQRIEYKPEVKRDIIEETRALLHFIFTTAKFAMGRQTWTDARIDEIGGGIEALIMNPSGYQFDFADIDLNTDVQARMDALMKCEFLNTQVLPELRALLDVLADIGFIQFKTFLFDMPLAAAQYLIKLFEILFLGPLAEAMEYLWESANALVDKSKERLEQIANNLVDIAQGMAEALRKVAESVALYVTALKQAVNDFFANLHANLDLNLLEWLEDIGQDIIDAIVFWRDLDNTTRIEEVIKTLRTQALNNVDEALILNFVEQQSQDATPQADMINRFVENQIFTSTLSAKINKMKVSDGKTLTNRWSENSVSTISSRNRIIAEADWIHIYNLRLTSQQKAQKEWENIQLRQQKRQAELENFNPDSITIHSPLMCDARNEQLPIYGEYVFISIDFGTLDIRNIINHQLSLNCEELIQSNAVGNTLNRIKDDIINAPERSSSTPLLRVDILLNGSALPLKDFSIRHHSIYAHVDKQFVRQGENHLVVSVTPPVSHRNKATSKLVSFYASKKYRDFPSNSIYINVAKSVINAPGNDHARATYNDLQNKEKIVITNASSKDISMGQWAIEDAYGHRYEFVKNRVLRAGSDYTLYIGNVPGRKYSWIAEYHGRKIAILNNAGEFLKLMDPNGKVVSHVYTGNPRTNKHIQFLKQSNT